MKTFKFYELPDLINDLEFDGDKTDLRIHLSDSFKWGDKTKKEYDKTIKSIDKIEYKGKNWLLYGWYDVSGFDYWMKRQREQNYIQLTIRFECENIEVSELIGLKNAICSALSEAENICNFHNYDPSNN